MGKCASVCPRPHRDDFNQIKDKICPFPCREAVATPSDKNDKKFFFINSEKKLDWAINYLDELNVVTESDINLLEQTLSELQVLKQSYAPAVSSYAFENLLIIDDEKSDEHGEGIFSSERDERFDGKESTKVSLGSKDVGHQGTLIFEIQKANFLHANMIEKYQLGSPYAVIKLYLSPNKSLSQAKDDKWAEVHTFETLKGVLALKPHWDQVFEYSFDESQQMGMYNLGISLFYISSNDDSIFQIGEEQIYSVSSLLDQKVQSKQVDFKDPSLKGVIARLSVRFQLVYDMEEIRKSSFRDVKTRIEKLMSIKEREMNGYKPDCDSGLNSARLAISHAESMGSASSNHEHEENTYYVG